MKKVNLTTSIANSKFFSGLFNGFSHKRAKGVGRGEIVNPEGLNELYNSISWNSMTGWKLFDTAQCGSDSFGRTHTMFYNPWSWDATRTIKDTDGYSIAKYATNSSLVKFFKRD